MKTFQDKRGRRWDVALTISTVKLVRDRLGVDLLQPDTGTPRLVDRLMTDTVFLADVLAVLLEKQIENNGVEDIFDCFDGATILAAAEAFFNEYADFFRTSGRPDTAKMISEMRRIVRRAVTEAENEAQKRGDEMMKSLDENGFGAIYTFSPENSASNPEDLRSAS